MSDRIRKIPFNIVDRLGRVHGIPYTDQKRAFCGADVVLRESENATGSTIMEYTRFIQEWGKRLQYHAAALHEVDLVSSQRVLCSYEGFVQRADMFCLESLIGTKLKLLSGLGTIAVHGIENEMRNYERRNKITMDESQKNAVRMALSHHVSVVVGHPGTGKTTTIQALADINKAITGGMAAMLAPTGRAARQITEKTGYPASTIHSKLKLFDDDLDSAEEVKITSGLIIIDEASMLDVYLTERLLYAVAEKCIIVFVGDPDQLPSVRPGAFLRDVIDSGVVPVSELTHVYRQKSGTTILDNAEKIRHGDIRLEAGSDFVMCGGLEEKELEDAIVEKYKKLVQQYGPREVYCLSPVKKNCCGVISLNEKFGIS